jgi:restriction system protein
LRWALTHLKGIGAVENSSRGVWAVTEKGQFLKREEVIAQARNWRSELAARRSARRVEEEGEAADVVPTDWRDLVLERLMSVSPSGFERLSQRVLREAGFANVTVTGRSGDGGIDGTGVYRLSLVSFPVYFQCKRYKGSVSASAVRDFRGAMVGRGEKGLLITTGNFTRDAQNEATRDGAPPVELIDGESFADLLKEYGLGIAVQQRIEEDVNIDEGFFHEYQ